MTALVFGLVSMEGLATRLHPLRVALIGAAGALAIRILGATWRVRIVGHDPTDDGGPKAAPIGALWHRDLICAAWHFRDQGIRIGVSRSRDGDLIARTLEQLGYAPCARGSSSRSGSHALRELIRSVQIGIPVALLTDGPRGPARTAKPGIVLLAATTGVPITPVAFACRSAWRATSWDRTTLPLPFTRVVCAFGHGIEVASDGSAEEREQDRRQIESAIDALAIRARNELDRT